MPAFTLSARCSALPSSTDPDQHIAHILFVVLTIHYRPQRVKFFAHVRRLPRVPALQKLVIEAPADITGIALQSFENATSQTIDFLDIAKFTRAELDNFPGLKSAMKDQVGQTLLALISELTPDDFPQLITIVQIFHEWLSWLIDLW